MFSLQRGPMCATALRRQLASAPTPPKVVVLKGGFAAWQAAFGAAPDGVIEAYDPDLYRDASSW